jgi:hypothetical protein
MKEHPLRMIKLDRNMSGRINQTILSHLIDFKFKPKQAFLEHAIVIHLNSDFLLLWKVKVHCCNHSIKPLEPMLSQYSPLHNFQCSLCMIRSYIALRLGLLTPPLSLYVVINILNVFLVSISHFLHLFPICEYKEWILRKSALIPVILRLI